MLTYVFTDARWQEKVYLVSVSDSPAYPCGGYFGYGCVDYCDARGEMLRDGGRRIAGAWIDDEAEVGNYSVGLTPAVEAVPVVRTYDESETVGRIFGF